MRRQAGSKAAFTGPPEDYCMQAGGGETKQSSGELLRKALVSPVSWELVSGGVIGPNLSPAGGRGVLNNVNLPHTLLEKGKSSEKEGFNSKLAWGSQE